MARGDSELIVKPVRGEYVVNLIELHLLRDHVEELVDEFDQFEITWTGRGENRRDDKLVSDDL